MKSSRSVLAGYPRVSTMSFLPTVVVVLTFLFLAACAGSPDERDGNVVEKMAIFSLIALTAFALMVISFSGGKGGRRNEADDETPQEGMSPFPLSADILASEAVYARDSRASFRKMVFVTEGTLLRSSPVTVDGIDPTVTVAGTWALTPAGDVRVSLVSPESTTTYRCVGRDEGNGTVQVEAEPGVVATWHFGPAGLRRIQAKCFGADGTALAGDVPEEDGRISR